MLSINTNYGSLFASKAAGAAQKLMNTAMVRLSSGLRINSAKDDAAGQGIAMRLSAKIKSLSMASRNASDAQAMIDTAEAAHQEVHNMLLRMREIAVQAASGKPNNSLVAHGGSVISDADRTALNAEVTALEIEITNIADNITFAGVNLGTSTAVKFQIGTENGVTLDHTFKDFDATTIGENIGGIAANVFELVNVSLSVDDNRNAGPSLSILDAAISLISTRRGELGALSNRLSSTIVNLDNIAVNLSSARGRIQDTDFAEETSNLAKSQIMQQAATAMLAQANASKQNILNLI